MIKRTTSANGHSGDSSFHRGERRSNNFRSGNSGGNGNYNRPFRNPSRTSNRRNDKTIDPNKFIKKAVEAQEEAPYVSTHKFADFDVVDQLKQNITSHKYVTPTPIQDQTIPHILAGKDVIGIANTGTGKTAAFLIPLLSKVYKDKSEKVLIVVPTRELAIQIDDEFRAFSGHMGIYSTICVGGASIGKQIAGLRRNPHFVIGTPGRLKDLINRNVLNLSRVHNIVLDEVDRMLDMGFVRDIKQLISLLPSDRQSLFFSATINKDAETIMHTLLQDPITVSVRKAETSGNVDQDIIKVLNREQKIEMLHDILLKEEMKKVLIFGRTKFGVEKLSRNLEKRGFKAASIHGDKSQYKRQEALNDFKSNRINILVATDVAARGLDIADVTHVINYDQPATYEDYVHRIGRTGRANKKGHALTFVD